MMAPNLFVLLASFNFFGLANHTQLYRSYCYNVSLVPGSSVRQDAACLRGSDAKGAMTKIYLGSVNTQDGSGSVSSAQKAECCPMDSGVMPAGWTDPSAVAAQFFDWDTDIMCPQGYFLYKIVLGITSSGNDKTTLWNPIQCIKPLNLDAAYRGPIQSVDFRGAFGGDLSKKPAAISCPSGSYIVGFTTASNVPYSLLASILAPNSINQYPGDLLDIDSIKCAYPLDAQCQSPVSSSVLARVDSSCSSTAPLHQYCFMQLTCPLGYLSNPVSGAQVIWNLSLIRYNRSSSTSDSSDPRLTSYPIASIPESQLQDSNFDQYAWQPNNDKGTLIMDLGLPRNVIGILTLGGCGDPMWRFCNGQWVSNYSYQWSNTTTFPSQRNDGLGNTNANQVATRNVSFTARYVLLEVTGFIGHSLLRADVVVTPDPFFMIKEASFGLNCDASNLGNQLTNLANACSGQRQNCTFFVDGSGARGNIACLNSAFLVIDWFYNGVAQPTFNVSGVNQKNITLVPLTPATLTCQPSGNFVGQQIACVSMDECRRLCTPGEVPGVVECNNCTANSNCQDSPGGFSCPCAPGYSKSNGVCTNVNECLRSCATNEQPFRDMCNNCQLASTNCSDNIGNFTCECRPGFARTDGSANVCQPINECIINCTVPNAFPHCNGCAYPDRCVDTNSSQGYFCGCPSGYSVNGTGCVDIDECAAGVANCPVNSNCTNTQGNYTCNCTSGFVSSPSNVCVDIDECALSNNTLCGGYCQNTVGSYRCLPYISMVEWRLAGSTTFISGSITLSSVVQASPDAVRVTVASLVTPFTRGSVAVFRYGSKEFPNDFTTQLCDSGGNYSTCNMSAGAGKNLAFSMEVCDGGSNCAWTRYEIFTFSFPAPTLTRGSLGTPSSSGTSNLTISTQFATEVVMNGTNFFPSIGPSPQITVSFGSGLMCTVEIVNVSALQCQMDPFSGVNATFLVFVGRGSSTQSVQGLDTVSVVLGGANSSCAPFPTILNVSGACLPGSTGTITGCPTQGGESLVISTDVNLSLPIVALVGGIQCPVTAVMNNRSVRCTLPGGVGRNLPVTIGHAIPSIFSLAFFAVSYAPPTIISVSSTRCTSQDNFTLVNCTRSAGTDPGVLSITGNNFGDSGAMVLAGGQYYPATHDLSFGGAAAHQHLFLSFPPFQTGSLQILVFARSDAGSLPGPSYSFVVCDPGTMTAVNGSCTPCPSGSFSNSSGQFRCVACDPGSAQSLTGQQSCSTCQPGTFSVGGATQCSACAAGFFSANQQASSCSPCSPGNYSLSGATICQACVAGTAQPLSAQDSCQECPVGFFSNSSSSTMCMPCLPSSFNVFAGLTVCISCLAGKFQSNVGSSECLQCEAGKFSNESWSALCVQCPTGKSATFEGSTACDDCAAGTYQNNCGMPDCIPCETGKFAAATGQIECDLCQPGRAINFTQQSSCQDCQAGEFQSSAGGSLCEPCPTGEFSVFGQTLVCQKCKQGKAQAAAGASGCSACEKGKFSAEEAQQNCTICAPGSYQTAEGQTACVECPPGSFSNSSTSCFQCAIGTYSVGFAQACVECSEGYYSLPYEGESQCFACSPGRFSNDTAATNCSQCLPGTYADLSASRACQSCDGGKFSSTLFTSCDKCSSGLYSAGSSLSECSVCPSGSTVNRDQTQCLCPAGQYASLILNARGMNTFTCRTNPTGTVTDLAGITQSDLVTLPGYWRSSNSTLVYYRCYAPQFCLGGKLSTCGNFREGPMCALCKPGYKSAGTNHQCALCPAVVETSWGITVAILLAVGVALVVAYWLILKMADTQQQELIAKERARLDATVSNLTTAGTVGDEYFAQLRTEIQDRNGALGAKDSMQSMDLAQNSDASVNRANAGEHNAEHNNIGDNSAIVEDEVEEEEPVKKEEEDEVVTYGQRRAPNFMYKIKIVVGFYQVASLLPNQGGIIWPQQFVDFINFFSFLNFDFVPWQNLACAVSMNYYTKILIVGLLPIAIIGALAAFFSMSFFFYGRKDDLATQMTKQNRILRAKRQFTKLVLFTIFLLYPFVSKTTLGVYNCIEIDGVHYLAADFMLLCGSPEWKVAAGYSAIFVALYPIGTPVIYYVLMSRVDRRSPDAFLELGFLYEAYVDGRWYWELLDMAHKLILTSIVVFMPNELIMGANMVIMVLYLILLLVCNPYLRKGDDRLHLLAQTNLFVLALMGHSLRLLDDPFKAPFASRSTVEALLSTLLIAINVLFLASFLIIAGRNIKKAYDRYMAKKKNPFPGDAKFEDSSHALRSFDQQLALVTMG